VSVKLIPGALKDSWSPRDKQLPHTHGLLYTLDLSPLKRKGRDKYRLRSKGTGGLSKALRIHFQLPNPLSSSTEVGSGTAFDIPFSLLSLSISLSGSSRPLHPLGSEKRLEEPPMR